MNCHASIKGLFFGMMVFSCTIISIIAYVIFRHKPEHDINVHLTNSTEISHQQHSIDYSIAIIEILNLFLLALSLFTTIWTLIKIRKIEYRSMTTRK